MKQYLVLVSMIALGVVMFNIIAGDGEDSVLSALEDAWKHEAEIRTYSP